MSHYSLIHYRPKWSHNLLECLVESYPLISHYSLIQFEHLLKMKEKKISFLLNQIFNKREFYFLTKKDSYLFIFIKKLICLLLLLICMLLLRNIRWGVLAGKLTCSVFFMRVMSHHHHITLLLFFLIFSAWTVFFWSL